MQIQRLLMGFLLAQLLCGACKGGDAQADDPASTASGGSSSSNSSQPATSGRTGSNSQGTSTTTSSATTGPSSTVIQANSTSAAPPSSGGVSSSATAPSSAASLGSLSSSASETTDAGVVCGAPGPCDANATCQDVGGVAVCSCLPGYTGDGHTCALDVIPAGVGWSRFPATHFTPVCQPSEAAFGFPADCRAVFTTWNGGIADTTRNRMVITGGGHNDYYGNELYAFDLASRGYVRLNQPTPLAAPTPCITTLPDGRPTSRHTFGGLTYLQQPDTMVMFGGVVSCESGGFVGDVWELDFPTLAANPATGTYWSQVIPDVPGLNYGGILGASDGDPVTGRAFLYTASGQFFSYDHATRATTMVSEPYLGGYHYTAVIDPVGRAFLLVGDDQLVRVDLESGNKTDLTSQLSACAPLAHQVYPGLAYDPTQNLVVGWAGGATVYLIDLAGPTCTTRTFVQDAPGPQLENGTNGRFRYFPSIQGFVLANDPDDDVYLLKLTP